MIIILILSACALVTLIIISYINYIKKSYGIGDNEKRLSIKGFEFGKHYFNDYKCTTVFGHKAKIKIYQNTNIGVYEIYIYFCALNTCEVIGLFEKKFNCKFKEFWSGDEAKNVVVENTNNDKYSMTVLRGSSITIKSTSLKELEEEIKNNKTNNKTNLNDV